MREGNSFSLFTLVGRGGTPSQVWGWGEYPFLGLSGGYRVEGYPIPEVGGTPSQVSTGGTPSQVQTGRYPIPGPDRGVPHSADGRYPIPGLDGGYPILLMGVLHPRGGGYPIPGLDRGYPIPGPDRGYPIPSLDRGYPSQVQTGVYLIPGLDRGVPHSADGGYPIPGLDGGTQFCSRSGGTFRYPPSKTGWDTTCPRLGEVPPPSQTGWDTPIQEWMG